MLTLSFGEVSINLQRVQKLNCRSGNRGLLYTCRLLDSLSTPFPVLGPKYAFGPELSFS